MAPRFRWGVASPPRHVAQAVEESNSIGRVPVQKKSDSHFVLKVTVTFYIAICYKLGVISRAAAKNLRLQSNFPNRAEILRSLRSLRTTYRKELF
jgi:hypothetical protein